MAAIGLAIPLFDIASHPDVISVLPSLQIDAATYDDVGRTLAATGDITNIPPRQPPGFVTLLALLYRLMGHSWLAAKLLLWVALIVATILAMWMAHRAWGRGAGAVAALLTATSPALRYYVGTIQYEIVAAAGLLAVLALSIRAVEARRPGAILGWTLGAGLAGGWLALTREVFVGVLPLVGIWLLLRLRARTTMRAAAAYVAAFLLLAALPVVAWSIVQFRTHDRLVIISDKGAVTFALGNNPLATGTFNADRLIEPSGVAFFKEMPVAAVKLMGRKALYFWGILRDGWNVPRPAALWIYRTFGGLVPLEWLLPAARGGWLLLAFIAASVVLIRRRAVREYWILPVVVFAVQFAHMVTLSSHRFAIPILPIVFVLIAGPLVAGCSRLASWIPSQRCRAAAAAAIAIGVIALQWAPIRLDVSYRAATLDAFNEIDRVDPVINRTVRFVDVSRGRRAAMILADEYLPAGDLQITIVARRGQVMAAPDIPVARVTLMTLAGGVACAEDIPRGIVFEDRYSAIWVPCRIASEGPATLFVETLGVADLAFDSVRLTWASTTRRRNGMRAG